MQPPYIPSKDADFENWFANFSTLLTATPVAYGLTAPDAVIVAAAYTAWNAAFLLATNPTTRTSATIAQKDAERASAEATVRPYAQAISKNASVSDALKTGIGVNLINTGRTPIPPPLTTPTLSFRAATPLVHQLGYTDSALPAGKAKPFGAIGIELWRAIGTVPAVDPSQADYYAQFTKSPLTVDFASGDVGKQCTYFARWVTRSGPAGKSQPGPWSAPLTVGVI